MFIVNKVFVDDEDTDGYQKMVTVRILIIFVLSTHNLK